MSKWIKKAGLTYHSPHKFRHGFAVYALKRARDVPALKAVSQNLMHENLSITDGIYGILSEVDVQKQIAELGNFREQESSYELEKLVSRLETLLTKK